MRPFIAGALDIASKITRQLNRCGHVMFSYSTLKTSLVAQTVKGLPTMWETRVQSLGGKDLLEKGMAAYSSILASRTSHPKKELKEILGFPGGSEVKASACNAGDTSSIPGLGRSPGEGNGNPLQYSCLENPMDRGAWWASVHGVAKSRTRLRDFTFYSTLTLWHERCLWTRIVSSNPRQALLNPWPLSKMLGGYVEANI